MQFVNPLMQIFRDNALALRQAADEIMMVRFLVQKEFLQAGLMHDDYVVAGSDLNSDRFRALREKIAKLVQDANSWGDDLVSDKHFNWKFLDPEQAPAIMKRLEEMVEMGWKDKDALEEIEYDCRSLSVIVVAYAVGEIEKQIPEYVILPTRLNLLCISLYKIACLALGYWRAEADILAKTTAGHVKPMSKTTSHIDVLETLLHKHGGEETKDLKKEAIKLTGVGKRRINQLLAEIKKGSHKAR